ncbi:MAG: hypothetical protein AB1477_04355 [Acidobacteriota bacterium]
MLKKKLIDFLSLFLLVLAGSAGVFAQGETARGIEKKDIRVLIVYPGNYNQADAEAFKNEIKPLVDAIANGAKLTKADAARKANPENNQNNGPMESLFGRKLMEWARTSQPGETASILVVTTKGNTGINARPNCNDYKCSVDCSVNNCAGRPAGWEPLGCCNFCNDKAFCCGFSCIKHIGHTAADHRTMTPKPGSTEPIKLVILLAKKGITNEQLAELEKFGLNSLSTEPFPAGLTIKTKSSPPVIQTIDQTIN